jgi:hypothetical protein
MKERLFQLVLWPIVLAFVLIAILVPLDSVTLSAPNVPPQTGCPQLNPQPCNGSMTVLYNGYASLTYCLLGRGALYLNGVYYPLTQPRASYGFEISTACPSIHP